VFLKVIALFHKKIGLFVNGRKDVFELLENSISKNDKVAWFHCASLGEFEQGRPVMEGLKKTDPEYKIVLTFFSPSGYEVRKDYEHADVISYLPIDSVSNAKRFLKTIHPSLAVFVKYEFWPNLLRELKKQEIPTLLVSGIFREKQVFFKSYGKWMRNLLKTFTHFFVQNDNSLQLLNSIGFSNVTRNGDTRFDRVHAILKRDNHLNFIEEFKEECYTLVAGSTWKEDEDLLVAYINKHAKEKEKFIIAPHNIKPESIAQLKGSLKKKTVVYSEREGKKLENFQVFIIDTIGILTKIYSSADVAYVGGGYTKSGIHNVLEPATFGIPIVIGPNYKKFREAADLISLTACTSITTEVEFIQTLESLRETSELRKKQGAASLQYIKASLGASENILQYISALDG